VRGLMVYAHHGVHEEERRLGQRFEIELDARLYLRQAGATDALEATVSYADLVALAEEIAKGRTFRLIEALADAIARVILERHPAIETVAVTVRKPSAPVPATLSHVAVEVTRGREE
jgi:7,8-dihydroneopterin aldolase/epimerase/oxygenase